MKIDRWWTHAALVRGRDGMLRGAVVWKRGRLEAMPSVPSVSTFARAVEAVAREGMIHRKETGLPGRRVTVDDPQFWDFWCNKLERMGYGYVPWKFDEVDEEDDFNDEP